MYRMKPALALSNRKEPMSAQSDHVCQDDRGKSRLLGMSDREGKIEVDSKEH